MSENYPHIVYEEQSKGSITDECADLSLMDGDSDMLEGKQHHCYFVFKVFDIYYEQHSHSMLFQKVLVGFVFSVYLFFHACSYE